MQKKATPEALCFFVSFEMLWHCLFWGIILANFSFSSFLFGSFFFCKEKLDHHKLSRNSSPTRKQVDINLLMKNTPRIYSIIENLTKKISLDKKP